MSIAVYDTYCGSLNSGDAIIMDAVLDQLDRLFPLDHKVGYPTHYPISYKAIRKIAKSGICFVGGTNLLSSRHFFRSKKNQWAVNQLGAYYLRNHCVLLGVGCQKYQNKLDWKAKWFYKTILSHSLLHSVRDSYTEKQLHDAGITNVINTGCPTMWQLTPEHCQKIPQGKGLDVVTTLTDYHKNPSHDRNMLELLLRHYRNVFFWIQGGRDLEYLKSLLPVGELDRIRLIGPTLSQYDTILREAASLDYVGTRLHAGIRALQHGRRSIIIGIDNRAAEKKICFNLMVVDRDTPNQIEQWIKEPFATDIRLPSESIHLWQSQFQSGRQT